MLSTTLSPSFRTTVTLCTWRLSSRRRRKFCLEMTRLVAAASDVMNATISA